MFEKIKDMDTVVKMSIVGGLMLLLFMIVGGVTACGLLNKDKDLPDKAEVTSVKTEKEKEETEKEDSQPKDYDRMIAVIKEVKVDGKELLTYDIEKNSLKSLLLDGATSIKDEFGVEIAIGQLKVGDIIDSKYDKKTMEPETIMISNRAWVRKNVQDITVDAENKTIRIGSDKYIYTDELVGVSVSGDFSVENLHAMDQVIAKGYKNNIWVIEVQSGHGTIRLENHRKYIGGIIEVDRKTYDIEKETVITVGAGTKSVIITKDKYSSVIRKIKVEENEEAVMDLSDVVAENTIISFNVVQEDVKLYIDDELQENYSEEITLEFGEYNIRAEKEGFSPWEGKLIAAEAYMVYEIDMKEEQIVVNIADPKGFSVFIDTNYVGEIPVETTVAEGNHTITIRKDGFFSKMYNVQIENTGKEYNFTFPELIPFEEETTVEEKTTKTPEETKTPTSDTYE